MDILLSTLILEHQRKPGGVDISRRTAFVIIGIYEKYELELKVHHDALPGDWNKLEIIRPVISQENAEEWLIKAKALSRSDLRKEVKEYYRTRKTEFYRNNKLPEPLAARFKH